MGELTRMDPEEVVAGLQGMGCLLSAMGASLGAGGGDVYEEEALHLLADVQHLLADEVARIFAERARTGGGGIE